MPNNSRLHHRSSILFIYACIWFFLWLLAGWNTFNADLLNYIDFYTRNFDKVEIVELADPGFNLLNKIFNNWGVSFELYHIIIYGVVLFYLCYQVWKRSYAPVLVTVIYIFTAYFGDVIQLRNFLAVFFLMIGLFALVDKTEKYPKLKFFICNLLASSFHIAFVFYFVFLLVDIKLKPAYVIGGSILLSVLGHSILGYLSVLPYVANNFFLSNRADSYLEKSSYWSVIICSCQYLVHYFVCKKCVAQSAYNMIDKKRFMRVAVLSSVLVIMTSVNMTFFRLFRNLLLFSSIYLINGYIFRRTANNTCYLVLYFAIMSYFHFLSGDVLKNVGVIFSNNLLW